MKIQTLQTPDSSIEVAQPVTKERFALLDGMRGVAAFTVVIFHAVQPFWWSVPIKLNGWLSVDFFFCLSGFVLAHAHDEEFASGRLKAGGFLLLRIVRLWPMIALGSLVAIALLPFHQEDWMPPPGQALPTALMSFFALPGFAGGKIVWLNLVFWSLLAEFIVNALYGSVLFRCRWRAMLCVIFAAAAYFTYTAIRIQNANPHFDTIASILPTIARAIYTFFAGVLLNRLYRLRGTLPIVPAWLPLFMLVLVLLSPSLTSSYVLNIVLIIGLVPVLVALGALAKPSRTHSLQMFGLASFPLYAIHLPVENVLNVLTSPLQIRFRLIAVLCFAVAAVVASTWIARHVEAPALRFLRRRLAVWLPSRAT